MSDLYQPPPEGFTEEEKKQYGTGFARAGSIGAPALGAAIVSNVAPDPTLPGALGYVPFVTGAEGLVGMADMVARLGVGLTNAGLRAGGLQTRIPAPPDWMRVPGEHAGATFEKIYDQLGGTKLESPAEELLKGVMHGAGTMTPIVGGGVLKSLPATVQGASRWLLPTTSHAIPNMAIGGGLGAGFTAAQIATQPAEAATPAAVPTQNQSISAQLLATPETAPPVQQPAAPAPSTRVDAPTQSISDQLLGVQPAAPAQMSGSISEQLLAPPPGVQAPTFGETGESETSVGQELLQLGLITLGVAAARFTHGLGAKVTTVGRDARMNDPAYAAAAAEYNNAKIARTGSEISGNDAKPPMPSANPLHSATNKVQAGVFDENAYAQNYMRLTAENPAAYDALANQFGLTHNNMSWTAKLKEFLRTGVDEASGVNIPSYTQYLKNKSRLSKEDTRLADDTLVALNEKDNRKINYDKAVAAGQKNINPDDLRHDFYHQDDHELDMRIAQGMSQPHIASLVDHYFAIQNSLVDVGLARKFFSPTEARDLKSTHPHHVADVDINGRVIHAFGPRNTERYTGVEQRTSSPDHALAQHVEELYRQFELNSTRQAFVDHQTGLQRQFPNSAQWVYEKVMPNAPQPTLYPTIGNPTAGPREMVIAVRDGTATKFWHFDDPTMYNVFSGNNANKASVALNAMGTMRRLFQSGTTGLAATMTGRIFPLVNALRTAIQAPINAPRGSYGGPVSKMLGGRLKPLTAPFDIPLNVVGAGYSFIRGSADKTALMLSHMLDPANTSSSTQLLSSVLTPQRLQTMSDSLKNYYLGTTTHDMRAGGIGGQGTPFRSEMPSFQMGEGRKLRLVSAELVPDLFLANGKMGGVRPAVVKLRSAAEELFSSLSDSSHEFFYRLNKNNPNMANGKLATETRSLTGDPGVSGGARAVQHVTSLLPYANVSLQGTARTARAIAEQPFSVGLTMATSLGGLAMLSILTSMRSKDHVDHLENELSTQQRAANVVFYTHPDPTINTQISLPQELRPFYAIMLDLTSKLFNTTAIKHDDMSFDSAHKWLTDYFSEHIEKSTEQSFLHAMNDVTSFANVPPIVNAFTAITGRTLNVDLERIYTDIKQGTFSLNSLSLPTGSNKALPNQPPGDSLLEGEDGKRMNVALSNIFGMVGSVFDHITRFQGYNKQTDWFSSLGTVGQDWVQHAKDLNPAVNFIWENPVRLSVRPAVAEKMQHTLDVMKQTTGSKTAEKYAGTTGRNGLPVPDTGDGEGKVPTDPVMRQMYFTVAAHYQFINSKLKPDIDAIKQQMGAVSSMNLPPAERRKWMNERTRDLADKWRAIQAHVYDLNANLSQQVGRSVDVGANIDWHGTVDQFDH